MLCSTPHSHCVVFLKSTFDHPIEGHTAFIQACDWLYRGRINLYFIFYFFYLFFIYFFFITHV
jgi:hypothetical protein